jgi:hypothetical protein
MNYRLFVPSQAVGANLVYFDMFNASEYGVYVNSVVPIVSGAVAVVGVVAVDLFLTHTTAVGTGGTAATYGGTALTACTFSPLTRTGQPVPATITARLTPTGGATAGPVIGWDSVFTEETNAGTYVGRAHELLKYDDEELYLPNGSGIRVVQGAVASVGNIGFNVSFRIKR